MQQMLQVTYRFKPYNVKVNSTLKPAVKAERESGYVAILFL